MPAGLSAIGKVLRSRRGSGEDAVGEDAAPEEELAGRDNTRYSMSRFSLAVGLGDECSRIAFSERDPDSRPPENAMQRVANILHMFYKWTKTPEALVCCEMGAILVWN